MMLLLFVDNLDIQQVCAPELKINATSLMIVLCRADINQYCKNYDLHRII